MRRFLALLAVCLLATPVLASTYDLDWEVMRTGRPRGLAVDGEGIAYLGLENNDRGATVSYDAAGEKRWSRRTPKDVDQRAIAVSPDGSTVVIAGMLFVDENELWMGTLDTRRGKKGWRRIIDLGLDGAGPLPRAVAFSPDGESIYVGGQIFVLTEDSDSTGEYGYVAKLDIDGDLEWAELVPVTGARVLALAVHPKGKGVFVTGDGFNEDGGSCCLLFGGFDADGEVTSAIKVPGPEGGATDGLGLTVSGNGKKIYVVGRTGTESDGFHTFLALFNNRGRSKWTRTLEPDEDRSTATSVTLSANGKTIHMVGSGCDDSSCRAILMSTNRKGRNPTWMKTERDSSNFPGHTDIARAPAEAYLVLGYGGATTYLGKYGE